MKLYLSSCVVGNDTSELEDWVKKYGNKLILIPNALDTDEEKEFIISQNMEYLTLVLGFDVKVISLEDYFGKKDKLKEDFKQYHTFYATGGNTFVLRKAMQLSGFDDFLKSISKNDDYLYGGYSAGICVLAPKLYGLDFCDVPINPYNKEKVLYDGLGLVDYTPVPHYDQKESQFNEIGKIVEYCNRNSIKYRTIKDRQVIVEEVGKEDKKWIVR